MHLLVGLGNPGRGYAGNRHNIGFMAADMIARRHSFSPFGEKFHGAAATGEIEGKKVLLLKPMTYMNESGRPVGAAPRFFKLSPGDVTVFHDDLDLAEGKVRVKCGGGAAGHNGLKSLDAHIGRETRRVRLGIGRPPSREQVTSYVLSDFTKADQAWLDPLLERLAEHVSFLVTGQADRFISRKTRPEAPQEKKTPSPTPLPQENGGGETLMARALRRAGKKKERED